MVKKYSKNKRTNKFMKRITIGKIYFPSLNNFNKYFQKIYFIRNNSELKTNFVNNINNS